MPHFPPAAPDLAGLRDALRGVRFALRRGGERISEAPIPALPIPAGQFAGIALRHGGELAKELDRFASAVAKSLLSSGQESDARMSRIVAGRNSAELFATASYTALKRALDRLDVGDVLISEAAARSAYLRVAPMIGMLSGAEIAAELTVQLMDLDVIRGTTEMAALAVFAMLLWLQSERPEAEDAASFEAAVDITRAIRQDVLPACKSRDRARLSALYSEFIDHV